ncbi:hypothetical protein JOF41_004988 [Saccharothrix coeruleofusca]|nr:hypothetical protein [Saccharothrix coeruleofusca]MBP2338810.1 hypothetical protein [Saccharothrix coeruleofusca]
MARRRVVGAGLEALKVYAEPVGTLASYGVAKYADLNRGWER